MLYPELLDSITVVPCVFWLVGFCSLFFVSATILQWPALVNAREPEGYGRNDLLLEQACPLLHFSYLMWKTVSLEVDRMKFIEDL